MKRIGLLSDTHGYLDPKLFDYFVDCDEVWHAGDVGDSHISDQLDQFKKIRAVYGNIDGQSIRLAHPLFHFFTCEQVKVLMIHIGGTPGNYSQEARKKIAEHAPGLFICGHSHILKVMRDPQYGFLYVNPGAAGKSGFHKIRTAVRFQIDGKRIENMEVIELGLRNRIVDR